MPTSPICVINPDHIGMLRGFGTLFLVALAISVMTGKAYFRRVIDRAVEPWMYWQTVAAYAILGCFILGGTFICPVIPSA